MSTPFIIVIIVLLVVMIVSSFFQNKKRAAQMQKEKEKREAIEPGFKVMTIGGITGTVVSVNDNSFVLETGDDDHKSYLTLDKIAIYNSENPNEVVETPETESEKPEDLAKSDDFDLSDDTKTDEKAE